MLWAKRVSWRTYANRMFATEHFALVQRTVRAGVNEQVSDANAQREVVSR